jgi:hypothetical protein
MSAPRLLAAPVGTPKAIRADVPPTRRRLRCRIAFSQ